MKLSVIIVNYNVKYYAAQCLRSVRRAVESLDAEVFVVDNHSKDGSCDYLRRNFPWVSLIESNHNLGFARGNNIAIRRSRGEYVLLLNPDTIVGEDVLRRAVEFMDAHPAAGSAGVMMHNADGSVAPESRRALPSPLVAMKKMLGNNSHYYMSHLPWDSPQRIEIVSGAFCMMRRSALDAIGLLDEDFFMYGEDIDISYRMLKNGYENWYLPLSIVHYKGESTHKSSFRYVHVFYNAMLIFFRKHYSSLSRLIALPVKTAIYMQALLVLLRMLPQMAMRQIGIGFGSRSENAFYIYTGSSEMQEACVAISRKRALDYCCCDDIGGYDFRKNVTNVVVFDTDMFSYAEIIDRMRQLAGRNVRLGTYSRQQAGIITPSEVLTWHDA